MVNRRTIQFDRTQMGGRSYSLPSRSVAAEDTSSLNVSWEGNNFINMPTGYVDFFCPSIRQNAKTRQGPSFRRGD